MNKFQVKVRGRQLVATDSSKQDFLNRLLDDYENRDITLSVGIEVAQRNIHQDQIKVYNAFILKAANHFGTDFRDMEKILWQLHPRDENGFIPVSKWKTQQLNAFIDQASSYLAQFGFNF